jgi:diguanylate cyclase (GGDEF)-like protein
MTAIPYNAGKQSVEPVGCGAAGGPGATPASTPFSCDEFLATVASLPGVVLYQRVVTPDQKIYYSYISEGARDIFGVPADEIIANPDALFSTHGSDYKSKFRERLLSASKSLTMWDVEASLVTRDGRKKYTHAIARPTPHADGSVVWTGIILDETRTREAVVECLSQGFLLFDSDNKLILRNSHYLKLYPSMTDVAVPGASYHDIVRAESASLENPTVAQERLERHRDARRVFELELADKHWVMINEHRTGDGNNVVLYTDISDIKQREREISHLAHYDSLTGLANRSTFLAKIEEASARHRQWGETFNVFMMDLDRFKNVNDTLGHPAGDLMLNETARRLKSLLRETDILARLGGDEFAIIQTVEADQEARAAELSHKIIATVSDPYQIGGNKVQVGVSIGIAFAPDHGTDANALLKKADLALYKAKSDGRNDYRFFDDTMGRIADARQKMETELRDAIAQDQLEIHYQPIVDFVTHELCGMEALVRWRHPERGLISPGQFIPIAEETGLINRIGEWILERACSEAAQWPKPIKVAVNLSPVQLANANLLDVVLCALVESGLPPERLELEITETALFKNDVDCLAVMRRLKNLGVSIALDDFGTGYSSLAQLTMFPFDKIKIDKSFTQNLGERPEYEAIVAAVITLAQKLGITTTAEGVETVKQFDDLTVAGVNSAQGYLLDRPTPSSDIDFNCGYRERISGRDASLPTSINNVNARRSA